MTYIEPKTTWNGDFNENFNINPDYFRIKGNIEHLDELQKETIGNRPKTLLELFDLTTFRIPYADHFNYIVTDIDSLKYNIEANGLFLNGYQYMKTYVANGYVPNYTDLNKIENNIKLIYTLLNGILRNKQQLPIQLGQRQYF